MEPCEQTAVSYVKRQLAGANCAKPTAVEQHVSHLVGSSIPKWEVVSMFARASIAMAQQVLWRCLMEADARAVHVVATSEVAVLQTGSIHLSGDMQG
ncbi:hypothetical protein WJX77_000710 [Trebouxia sp. C0004]